MLLNLETFFGRFHPLIVHLPIGFLVLAVFFGAISLKTKYRQLRVAVSPTLLIGSLSALFACITGYVLSLSGDFDADILDDHFWAGITTTVISFLAYLVSIKRVPIPLLNSNKSMMILLGLLFVFINVTGHLGGSLTHGSDFLSLSILSESQIKNKKVTNIDEALVFTDLVHPILQRKCGNCHNPSKKKGKLSMQTYEALLKGGKNGPVIKPGNVDKSELVKRISLDPRNEEFMPTDGKPPLTEEEATLIKWWIDDAAAPVDKKLMDANPPEEVRKFAAAYLGLEGKSGGENEMASSIIAPPVPQEVIKKLKASGFMIKYLNFEPDLLDVTLPSSSAGDIKEKLRSLLLVKDNIIWLNVSGNNVSDKDLAIINQLTNLQRLKLNNNPIGDKGVQALIKLKNLQSLNLYNTKVTIQGLAELSSSAALKRVYVWKTGIKESHLITANLPYLVLGTEK